jgi:hypothetical protein
MEALAGRSLVGGGGDLGLDLDLDLDLERDGREADAYGDFEARHVGRLYNPAIAPGRQADRVGQVNSLVGEEMTDPVL